MIAPEAPRAAASRKLGLKERYALQSSSLDWEPSYQPADKIFPYQDFEGIKIHDWDAWQDPFRLTMDAYWKFQSEKERKLYAVIDSFSQNNGHLNLTDARYINAVKLFLTGVTPMEYAAHRGYANVGRHFRGAGARIACQMQAIDELRHAQTQIHTISHYNKFFDGLHDPWHMWDRVWFLSVPKSFFEDARTAGPFEYLTSISFSFEYVLTSLLFVPYMSGAAYNGDMATVTFGFSAQSDEARHMTLGLEIVKFMLEQDEANVPIVQRWIDKWFWRGYRLLGLVAMMMDYMLPKRVMSWQEAWEMYFEEGGGALFNDLSRYGIRLPKYHEVARAEKDRLSHEVWSTIYQYGHAEHLHTWMPSDDEMSWLSGKYPNTFDTNYRQRFEHWRSEEQAGRRFYNQGLPALCQVCQLPLLFTEPDDPMTLALRSVDHKGQIYRFCSDGCKDIFLFEPDKYVQAWLPVHEILKGNCGGQGVDDVLRWYHYAEGEGGEYNGSAEDLLWRKWHAERTANSAP